MKRHFSETWHILRQHWRQLAVFEILYRIVGIVIIYPIVNRLFFWSIQVTGDVFIVNRDFVGYLLRPTTLFVLILIVLLFGLYVTFEVVTLSILFHQARFDRPISLQVLLLSSFKRIVQVFKRYHIVLVSSAVIFLVIVEGLHITGVASTIRLPMSVQDDLQGLSWFVPLAIGLVVIVFYLFFETMFFELQCTIHSCSIKENVGRSRRILKNQRLGVLLEFLVINVVINLILYGLYLLVVLGLGVIVAIIEDGSIAFAVLLTTLYSIYLVIGFVASIVLIPVNFAWINARFYEKEDTGYEPFLAQLKVVREQKPLRRQTFHRLIAVTLVVFSSIVVVLFSVDQIQVNNSVALTNNPSVISHRGGGFYAPENTLSGIEEGIRLGADAIEIDVRFTKDGVPVLFHDATTGRTTDDVSSRFLIDVSYDQLTKLDVGSWFSDDYKDEVVPTLEEALLLIDRRVDVLIELKASIPDSATLIVDIIEQTNMSDKVKILSFQQSLLEEMKELNSDIETVLLLGEYTGGAEGLISLNNIDYFGVRTSIALEYPDYIQTLQKAGKGVYVWTINDQENIETINRLGVNGIITDEPLLVREIVYGDTTKSIYTELLKSLFTIGQ